MDIGDLHGSVQQQAVRTGPQQESFEYLTKALERATESLNRLQQNAPPQ